MSSQDVRIVFKGDAADAVKAAKILEHALNGITKNADAATRQLKGAGSGLKTDSSVREGKKLEKQLNDTRGSSDKLKKSFAGIGTAAKAAAAAALVALGGLAVGAKKSVDAAVDLNEQLNKAKVVFRGAEQQVIQFSKTTASSLGISQRAALEAAGTFGNMLVPMGFARGEAAKMSTSMVQLAADMASFNNASPEETLKALRSGLAGETEPLRKFGVFLNDARVQAEALSLGLIKQGETLTAAGKAAAVYSIIMKDTKDAQGDFARTSDSLANQQRILKAELENAAAVIGAKLIPAASKAIGAFRELIPKLAEFGKQAAEVVGPAFEQVGERIGKTLRDIGPQLARALPVFGEFGGRAANAIVNAFGDIAEIVGRSVARIADVIAKHEGTLRAIGERLATAFSGAWDGAKEILEVFFVQVLPAAIAITIVALDKLTSAAETVADAVGGWDNAFQLIIGGLLVVKVGALATSITVQLVGSLKATQAAAITAGTSMTVMGALGARAMAVIKAAMISTGVGALLVGIGLAATYVILHWDKVKSWFSRFGAWLGEFFSDLWRGIKEKAIGAALVVLEPFSHLPGKLGGWARDAKDAANRELAKIKFDREWDRDGAEAGGRWASGFLRQAAQQIADGMSPGAALAPDNKNPDPVKVTPGAGAGAHPDSKGGRRTGGSTGAGQVSFTGKAVASPPKAHVVKFVRKVAAVYGAPLSIYSGTRPGATVKDTDKPSQHGTGDAADISTPTNAMNVAVGQAALIAAGMPEAQARKTTSYAGTVNGVNILFQTNVGGNHFNHVHVGLTSLPDDSDDEPPTNVNPDPLDVGATGAETATEKKQKAATAAKSLAAGVKDLKGEVSAALKGVSLKDVPEARELVADLNKVLDDLADGVGDSGRLAKLKAQAKKLSDALKRAVEADEIRDSIVAAKNGIAAALKEGLLDERTALEAAAAYERARDLIRKAFSKGSDGGKIVTAKELAAIKKELQAAGDTVKKGLEELSQALIGAADAFLEQGLIGPQTASKITAAMVKYNDLVARAMRDNVLSPKEVKAIAKVWDSVTDALVDGMGPALAQARKQFGELLKTGFIDDDAAAAVKSAFAEIAAALKDGFQPADIEVITSAWSTIKSGVADAADALQKALPKFRSFQTEFKKAFGDGLLDDTELAKLKDGAAAIGGALGDGVAQGLEELQGKREQFRGALEQFRSHLADVFREKVILRFQLAIDFANTFEQIARTEDELERASTNWGDVIAAGSSRVTDAIEKVLESERQVLEATRAYAKEATAENKARLEQTIKDRQNARVELERIAAGELTDQERLALEAGQRLVSATQEKHRQILEEEKAGWEAATTETLARVNAFIDGQIGAFERGEQSWETTLANIRAKLVESGVDAETAGAVMSGAITSAMTAAASAMTTAMQQLVTAINQLVLALGGVVNTAEGHANRMAGLKARVISDAAAIEQAIATLPPGSQPGVGPGIGENPGEVIVDPKTGKPIGFQHGGRVPGTPRWPTDGIPILAGGDEHILNPPQIEMIRKALAAAGPRALAQLRGAARGNWSHLRRFLPGGGRGGAGAGVPTFDPSGLLEQLLAGVHNQIGSLRSRPGSGRRGIPPILERAALQQLSAGGGGGTTVVHGSTQIVIQLPRYLGPLDEVARELTPKIVTELNRAGRRNVDVLPDVHRR